MKILSFLVALLAALATVVVPITPANAAPNRKAATQKLLNHAERGEALILTAAQVERVRVTNKALHAKLMAAYRSNTVPQLTASEKSQLQADTRRNLSNFKAGSYPPAVAAASSAAFLSGAGWIVLALVVVVLALILFSGFASQSAGARFVRAALTQLFWLPRLFGATNPAR